MNDTNFHVKHDFHPELIIDDFDNKSWLDKKHFYNVKELEAYDGLELFVI